MVYQDLLFVTFIKLAYRASVPALPSKRRRMRIIRHLHMVRELLNLLAQPVEEIRTLWLRLTEQEHFASCCTWKQLLKAIPKTLPARIGCLGRLRMSLIQPWASSGLTLAIDSIRGESNATSDIKNTVSKEKSHAWRLIPKPTGPNQACAGGSINGDCMSSPYGLSIYDYASINLCRCKLCT